MVWASCTLVFANEVHASLTVISKFKCGPLPFFDSLALKSWINVPHLQWKFYFVVFLGNCRLSLGFFCLSYSDLDLISLWKSSRSLPLNINILVRSRTPKASNKVMSWIKVNLRSEIIFMLVGMKAGCHFIYSFCFVFYFLILRWSNLHSWFFFWGF